MKLKPSLRSTETYTETNFLRVHTVALDPDHPPARHDPIRATIEHLDAGDGNWKCATIVDGEEMTREDARTIARGYAREHDIPVIYECHSD